MRGCDFVANTPSSLLFHLRTHVRPTEPQNRQQQIANVHAADAQDKKCSLFETRKTIPQQVNGYAAGAGFVACLVVRNISRAIAGAASHYRQLRAAGEESGSFSYAPASASTDAEPGEHGMEIELTPDLVVSAVTGLAAVEKQVLQYAGANGALATYLTELLQNTAAAKLALESMD
jgi:hypothetical protein